MTPELSDAALRGQRVVWVDAARAIAMFFIIWLHTGKSPAWNGDLVGGALCLFFVFAGYFTSDNAGKCAKRAAKLLLLWLFWSFASAGLHLMVKPWESWDWDRVFGWGVGAYNTPLWFLRNLAVYQLIMAGLMYLRILPRYSWALMALLMTLAYAASPSQHVTMRFDWWMVVMIGFALKSVPLQGITAWLKRHYVTIVVGVSICLLQPIIYHELLQELEISRPLKDSSLAVESVCFMLLYCLVALLVARFVPRVASFVALMGSSMMFCYITHSFTLAPLYHYSEFVIADNVWVPVLLLPLLTGVYLLLKRCFPRAMRLLFSA